MVVNHDKWNFCKIFVVICITFSQLSKTCSIEADNHVRCKGAYGHSHAHIIITSKKCKAFRWCLIIDGAHFFSHLFEHIIKSHHASEGIGIHANMRKKQNFLRGLYEFSELNDIVFHNFKIFVYIMLV